MTGPSGMNNWHSGFVIFRGSSWYSPHNCLCSLPAYNSAPYIPQLVLGYTRRHSCVNTTMCYICPAFLGMFDLFSKEEQMVLFQGRVSTLWIPCPHFTTKSDSHLFLFCFNFTLMPVVIWSSVHIHIQWNSTEIYTLPMAKIQWTDHVVLAITFL